MKNKIIEFRVWHPEFKKLLYLQFPVDPIGHVNIEDKDVVWMQYINMLDINNEK